MMRHLLLFRKVLKDAIYKGCRRFIIGIGGSATNDGGAGMLQALGFGLLDGAGRQIPFGAAGINNLETITEDGVIPELKDCVFIVACDVSNPLCGKNGCSAVYGPQKGATPNMVYDMDKWMSHYAEIAKIKYPDADENYPGAGAAGGMGFAFKTFLNATLRLGIDIVIEETGLEEYIKTADIVITGEGKLDGQTSMGKAPIGVAKLAKKYGKPVIAFVGGVTSDAGMCNENGIDAFFPIIRGVTSLTEAMDNTNARSNMADAAEQVIRLIRLYSSACGQTE